MTLSALFCFLATPFLAAGVSTRPKPPNCIATGPQDLVVVTPGCVDPEYSALVIDSEQDETEPVPHRKVAAHLNPSNITVNIYLPPHDVWEGRFFQMVYPTHEADALESTLAFGSDSGGYTVQIQGVGGYRADAAAAKFSRKIAADYYGVDVQQIHGYIYGGSGGSFQTVGAIENTQDVWQGAVPIVQAVPVSFMGNPSIRCMAGMVLRDRKDQIEAAAHPGGSGDLFAGLTSLQHQILIEATLMGIPLEAWEVFEGVTNCTAMNLLRSSVQGLDPTYADDFWSQDGYLGTEQSELGALFRLSRVEHSTFITNATGDGEAILVALDSVPNEPQQIGLDFTVLSLNGSEAGFFQGAFTDNKILVNTETTDPAVVAALVPGHKIKISNQWFIAMHAYHRYQVPNRDGFYGYDQFRDFHGQPIYPQRPIDTSAAVARSASGGGTHTGHITAKVIVVDNLVDYDAFPWHADWYRGQVLRFLGEAALDDNYRLWFNENAGHDFGPVREEWRARSVDFTGIYHQALRDLSNWVEHGIPPPGSTLYTVSQDNQVKISASATDRLGIQPSVSLKSNCSRCRLGQKVTFIVHTEVPPNAGSIVQLEWDPLGTAEFMDYPMAIRSVVDVQIEHTYDSVGDFQPVVRVTSQREGNATNLNRRVMNLGRLGVSTV